MQKNRSTEMLTIFISALLITLLSMQVGFAQADTLASVEGWFSIIWGDGYPGTGEDREIYTLTDSNGQTTQLSLDQNLVQPLGGVLALDRKYVAAQGDLATARLSNNSSQVLSVSSLTLIPPPLAIRETLQEDTLPAVTGSKPWVSIMCKFSDKNDEPKNLSYFQGMYASSKPGLDHYWREVSFNTVNIVGSNAYGWFTLPHPESYYNPSDTQGGADLTLLFTDCVAAADPIVNFSTFSGINMMFNTNFDNGFAWGGSRYADLDGVYKRFSVTWEPPWGYADITVIAHEMGHGFGLPHSSGMYGQTYDNEWDVMSDSWANCGNSRDSTYGCLGQHTISYHKDRLGWIPASEQLVTDGSNVTVTLDNLALQSTANYKMIKIPLEGTTSRYYTVEVRQKTGYDIKLPGKAVIIHEVDTTRQRPANVVDIDGDGDTGDAGAMWVVGETYANPDGDFSVEVLSESANGYQVAITFPGPDLIVDSSSVSSQALTPGQSLTLSATVRNQGDAQAESSTLRYYRSSDATISTSDTSLGTDSVPILNQGGNSAQSLVTSAPAVPGIYFVGACVDTVTNESSTNNNCSAGIQITVTPQGEPDLVVQSPSISASTPVPGQSIILNATVRNQGTAQANSTTLRYFRSTDNTISTSDTEIGTDSVTSLGQNSTSPESLTFNAPTTPGTYYFGACVNSVSGESQTANNCSSALTVTVSAAGAPDLVVQSVSVNDTTPETGQSITLNATVRNQGSAMANSTTLRYFRSTNSTISTSDTEIGTDPVASLGQNSTSPESLTFNAPSTSGTYYFGACVNSVSGESQTGNNCSSVITLTVSEANAPDLVVQSVSVSNATPETGQPITLNATVRNQGSVAANSTTLRYFRSTNSTISTSDTEIGTDPVASLGQISTSPESLTFNAPSIPGTYYFGACVNSVSGESQTGNNCSSALPLKVTVNQSPDFPWNMFLPVIIGSGR